MQPALEIQSCKALELVNIVLQPGVTYEDGCHVWICVPELGWLEYHPFSVASCSLDPLWRNHLLVHAKVYNKWTTV
jgi:hypothetical protein